MRLTSKSSWIIGVSAAVALIASAAEAAPRHANHHAYDGGAAYDRYGPYDYGHAYDAYRGRSEEFTGSSVPYDPDGPGYNDFQLQGR